MPVKMMSNHHETMIGLGSTRSDPAQDQLCLTDLGPEPEVAGRGTMHGHESAP